MYQVRVGYIDLNVTVGLLTDAAVENAVVLWLPPAQIHCFVLKNLLVPLKGVRYWLDA